MCTSIGFSSITLTINSNNYMEGIVPKCNDTQDSKKTLARYRANGFVFNVFLHIGIQIPFSSFVLLLRTRCIHVAYFLYRIYCLRFHLRATNMDNLGKYDSCLSTALCASKLSEHKRSTYLGPSSSMKTPSKEFFS